jgi:pyruvate-ferredoxin/flavodoxin oxidoreductase
MDNTVANLLRDARARPGRAPDHVRPPVPAGPGFRPQCPRPIDRRAGDRLPVSAVAGRRHVPDRHGPYEKRNLSLEIPVWDPQTCIQCGKCILVCPHAAIRSQGLSRPNWRRPRRPSSNGVPAGSKDYPGLEDDHQVAPEDCTGCALCVDICPIRDKKEASRKAINMAPAAAPRAENPTGISS